jgi:hypothetical protein
MDATGPAISYTFFALVLVLLIFLSALAFVLAARRGNRRFKWRRGHRTAPDVSRSRDS